ncbi:hypothetical protein [Actinokineospora sp. NBRC 105648]|uniref:hypothetical protein n=1 Tax=Actinokineospora sp. NBRC 105648 TaxID=3032206 RepID=UPI0024A4143D|nr:hypothetical protein [Actinokineospora sp. NBRC 105648]GLZ42116.1 hypothetical protein Acsp05_57400 [Actinokineospora sp. NBRC 105648]
MTGPNQGFAEAVVRFRAELSAAVTRARRASADAREQGTAFRRETERLAGQDPAQRAAVRQARRPDPEDDDFSQHQILFHGG